MSNKGFGFGHHTAFFMVFVFIFMVGLATSWSSTFSTGATRSFQHVSLLAGVETSDNAEFGDVTFVSPWGPAETISNCDNNVLKTGWVDILDHDSEPDPLSGVFNNVIDMREDINSVTLTYEIIGGQPLDLTVTPIKKFEYYFGAPVTCDDNFAELVLERKGDEGCWSKTFSAPLNLAPDSYELHTQIFYDRDLILDSTKTISVVACNQ